MEGREGQWGIGRFFSSLPLRGRRRTLWTCVHTCQEADQCLRKRATADGGWRKGAHGRGRPAGRQAGSVLAFQPALQARGARRRRWPVLSRVLPVSPVRHEVGAAPGAQDERQVGREGRHVCCFLFLSRNEVCELGREERRQKRGGSLAVANPLERLRERS